jgi:hypothetical protein
MTQLHTTPQSALRNVPKVVVRPAWENAVACSYLPKVRRIAHIIPRILARCVA